MNGKTEPWSLPTGAAHPFFFTNRCLVMMVYCHHSKYCPSTSPIIARALMAILHLMKQWCLKIFLTIQFLAKDWLLRRRRSVVAWRLSSIMMVNGDGGGGYAASGWNHQYLTLLMIKHSPTSWSAPWSPPHQPFCHQLNTTNPPVGLNPLYVRRVFWSRPRCPCRPRWRSQKFRKKSWSRSASHMMICRL